MPKTQTLANQVTRIIVFPLYVCYNHYAEDILKGEYYKLYSFD